MTGDNVIPFPARPEPGNSGLPDPAGLAQQLLAAGHSPAGLVSALGGLGASWFEPPRLQAPTLLPRRDRPARYTLRVDLVGAKPPIWRRITVSSDIGLERLHDVLQAAMGWTDSHLHNFRVGSGVRGFSVQPFLTAFDIEEGDEGTAEADVRLDEVLGSVGDGLVYEYDFGDGWDHLLKLEKIEEVVGDETVEAHVVAGRRACPPEDVGGINTYNDLVVALAVSGEVEQWLQDRIDWLPDGFDPAAFDLAEADADTENAGAGRLPRSIPFSHPEFVDLMLKLGPYGPLAELAAEAVPGPTELSVDELAGAMRPLLALLDLVGEQGVDLTGAGYLKPALVRQVAVETGIAKTWIGSMSREDSTPPVANLRRTAQALGLLRKYRGRLLLTKTALRVRQDPQALWDLLVDALPAGKHPYERQAGVVALLATAAGRRQYPLTSGGEILTDLGWLMDEGAVTDGMAYSWAMPTLQVLAVLEPDQWRQLWAGAGVLARAALRPIQAANLT